MSPEELLAGLSVVAGLVVLEGLLSVDNVLGIAALASDLPAAQQRKAIRIGLFLAYLFRVLALFVAGWLATNTWVRWLGAGYLIWLMSSHLTKGHAHDVGEALIDEDPSNDATPVQRTAPRGLRIVLLQIGLMDLSLSIDNVIAAVGLAPKNPNGRSGDVADLYRRADRDPRAAADRAACGEPAEEVSDSRADRVRADWLCRRVADWRRGVSRATGAPIHLPAVLSSSPASCSSSGWRCFTTPMARFAGWSRRFVRVAVADHARHHAQRSRSCCGRWRGFRIRHSSGSRGWARRRSIGLRHRQLDAADLIIAATSISDARRLPSR